MSGKKLLAILLKVLLSIVVIIFFVWSYHSGYYQLIWDDTEGFFFLFKQHLNMVLLSSFLAIAISVPLGIFVTRPKFKKVQWLIMNTANLGQTIPSLAILALAMTIMGIGFKPAVFALFLYSLLPILRNTVAGIDSIKPELLDAAKGMGYKPYQILFKIELPNAAFSILAGIRTAVVLNIGTAALAYLVGGGGLGDWIFTGIMMRDNIYLLSGAVPVTLFALLADQILRIIENLLISKGVRQSVDTD
ncbi:osmoprotectant transport system permease protein [Salinibacillus kushneri]|uniref:Osmoprotectant transport system permease protein n=1 Tax=Salinibacillus kushneri TaxID=237682 RepID=A0A1I0CIW5_9BACI|nr:ABC transporter permease [Salinibacillus kushneri]SET19557.1 osmoprotectant transport system permease protein [Salinibacillus kushneri]